MRSQLRQPPEGPPYATDPEITAKQQSASQWKFAGIVKLLEIIPGNFQVYGGQVVVASGQPVIDSSSHLRRLVHLHKPRFPRVRAATAASIRKLFRMASSSPAWRTVSRPPALDSLAGRSAAEGL